MISTQRELMSDVHQDVFACGGVCTMWPKTYLARPGGSCHNWIACRCSIPLLRSLPLSDEDAEGVRVLGLDAHGCVLKQCNVGKVAGVHVGDVDQPACATGKVRKGVTRSEQKVCKGGKLGWQAVRRLSDMTFPAAHHGLPKPGLAGTQASAMVQRLISALPGH